MSANTSSIQKMSAKTDINLLMECMSRDGAVIISDLLSKTEIALLQQDIEGQFDGVQFCEGFFFGHKTKRLHSLVAKSQTCRELILNSVVTQITQGILKPYCNKVQLNLTQGIQIWPGEKAQFIHRDDAMFPAQERTCEYMVNAMWACSEFNKENGGTVLVPGSHRWKDRKRMPTKEELIQAEMDPGEVLIYLGSLIHGGGENRAAAPRTGIAIGYCLGWLRQYENQYLAAPPNIAKHFPKELQDLLGYCVHRPNLGMYEGAEPNILFDMPDEIITHDFLTDEQNEAVAKHLAALNNRVA